MEMERGAAGETRDFTFEAPLLKRRLVGHRLGEIEFSPLGRWTRVISDTESAALPASANSAH